ncbi:MAG: FtsQ-type POTRA domain-containing protein [Actinobacteria bacterium]|nr:FtsQ-type POTRA domain-containing protein [Actinomycetota bacterium]
MVNNNNAYKKIIAQRKRRSAKRKFLFTLWILFLFAFFIFLIWGFNFFYNSNYFKISSIQVTGNEKYMEQEIFEVADIFYGLNIFEADKKKIEDTLLRELAWLKSASMKKIFPDRIEITVAERKPFVKAAYGADYYIIDEEGIVLEKINVKDSGNYDNIIAVKNAFKYRPEEGEKIAKKNLLSCGLIYRSLDLELKGEIREAYIIENFAEDIVFLTSNNIKIIFGTSDRIEDKNAILRDVLEKLKSQGISYSEIDLRNVDNPLIR